MATPFEDLKKAITTSDWKLVARVYKRLTGDKVELPVSEKKPSHKLKQVPGQKEDDLSPKIDIATPVQEKKVDVDKFRVIPQTTTQPGETTEDGKRFCRREAWTPPTRDNRFVPDPNEGADVMAEDVAFIKKREGKKVISREPVEEPTEVKCGNCPRKFMVHAWEKTRTSEGEPMKMICPSCVKNRVSER